MKIRLFTLSALSFFALLSQAQTLLYNDGATVTIQPGAVLYVEGGVTNTATGTINNDGTLEVKGDFLNQGTWDSTDPNTIKFSGDANSSVTSGGATFRNVVIAKGSGFNVNLMDDMSISDNLDFASTGGARLATGDFDLLLTAASTITGHDADEYIAATGPGMVQKSVTGNGTYTFPIGDLTNYSPLSTNFTGSSYTNAYLRAKVNDMVHPEKPDDASDFISRYWDIEAVGIADYENTLTGTYVPADVTGTASLIKGTVYDDTEWSYDDSNVGANVVIGTTMDEVSDFTGTNFFGAVSLKIYLQGAYSGGQMTTLLPTLGQPAFPLISPYPDAPDTATAIPSDVTDWVKLELRQVSNPSVVIGRGSAFVKSDGSIVGLDGTSLGRIKNGEPTAIVAVFHRNHLPIRTSIGLNTLSPTLHDFSTGLGQAFDNGSITTNESMVDLGSGVFGMWRGNVNSDLSLNLTDFIQTKQNTNPSQNGVYSPFDVNLDKNKNLTDFIQAKQATNPSKSAHL